MHFPKGQTPPADGFWSLTMYDGNYFFVANPLNRYTLSSRQRSQVQRGRLARPFHPEGFARPGEGIELATGSRGQIHPHAAALLAEGNGSVDPRRHLAAASSG